MTVLRYRKRVPGATLEALQRCEGQIGHTLPALVAQELAEANGGRLVDCSIEFLGTNTAGLAGC